MPFGPGHSGMGAALPKVVWHRRRPRPLLPTNEWVLLSVLLAETALFSVISKNFFSLTNALEVLRFSVELGLLSVAMTPVIISGGIDLSVGSMMGLSAVSLGAVWQTGAPLALATVLALLLGCAGGALNALLIARFHIPPLIVTLGTYSMFRGIAEGITHGTINYTGFPKSFLFLGQGYLWGIVPVQVPIFLLVVIGYAILLHSTVVGRALYAIGLGPDGARYAGIPVRRRVALTYLLSGLVSSLAAVIYVAHVGQARSDAGNGYELSAVTAVVLGGTSVFGGRGTLAGTLLGLFSLSILQNGLHLAALPSELTGVLTGALLIAAIGVDRFRIRSKEVLHRNEEVIPMKNSQVAILCGAILLGSLMVAATNFWLVRMLESGVRGANAPAQSAISGRRPVIAVMPKAKGDPYFVSCRKGAEEAARELGVDMIWDGPTSLDAAQQNQIVEDWITRQVDVIAVAVENQGGISTVLGKARQHGIPVLTWDADASPNVRNFFVNQATPEAIANSLTDEAAHLLGGKGDFAIITGALTAANQNEWIAFIKQRLSNKYPEMKLAMIEPSDDDRDKAFSATQTILKVYPNVKLVMAISGPAVPGAAEAVRQAGRHDVYVIGLSLPSICRPYIHDGIIETIVLWNPRDLGYLTVYAATLLAENRIPPGATSISAGRLGVLQVRGSEIILGTPLLINQSNIDALDF
jgi:ribose/xylose/arabinose/galactoside ABC-type transport system permease subunit/ABC-type sugar transport system substrate-binding protein